MSKNKKLSEMSLEELRSRYVWLRKTRRYGNSPADHKAFDEQIKAVLPQRPGLSIAEAWCEAAHHATIRCHACNGTGIWHGCSTANDGGPCYDCRGTGTQTMADAARLNARDRHFASRDGERVRLDRLYQSQGMDPKAAWARACSEARSLLPVIPRQEGGAQ